MHSVSHHFEIQINVWHDFFSMLELMVVYDLESKHKIYWNFFSDYNFKIWVFADVIRITLVNDVGKSP